MCEFFEQEDIYLKVALSCECFLTGCTSERLVPCMGAVPTRMRSSYCKHGTSPLASLHTHTHNTPSDQAPCIHKKKNVMLEHYMLISNSPSSVENTFIQSTERRRWEINKSKVTESFFTCAPI
jgi:hypothetical protein